MPLTLWLVLALAGSAGAGSTATGQAPSYSAASVVNAASNQATFAPNTFVTIYGGNLAFTTRGLTSTDISGDTLPTVLAGTGVRVWVDNIPAPMYYVSPKQINILLPTNLSPGSIHLRVQVDSTYGPAIPITLAAVAPAFFQLDAKTVVAAHVDGSVVTDDHPAAPGEWVILYATGLGATIPQAGYGEIPEGAAILAAMAKFGLILNGTKVDPRRIAYAGVAPGYGGLYQFNCLLPDDAPQDPEIQIIVGDVMSPSGLYLPVRTPAATP